MVFAHLGPFGTIVNRILLGPFDIRVTLHAYARLFEESAAELLRIWLCDSDKN